MAHLQRIIAEIDQDRNENISAETPLSCRILVLRQPNKWKILSLFFLCGIVLLDFITILLWNTNTAIFEFYIMIIFPLRFGMKCGIRDIIFRLMVIGHNLIAFYSRRVCFRTIIDKRANTNMFVPLWVMFVL